MKSLVGIKGGSDATYFEVLAEQHSTFTDYPSIKDGRALHYDDPEYWQHKTTRQRKARVLTVTGNAVSCESTIKDMGLGASAVGPNTVYVYAANDKIRASERAAEIGRHTSKAKKASSAENGKKGGRPRKPAHK